MSEGQSDLMQYNYVFWCLAMSVALTIWVLAHFFPDQSYVGADVLIVAVMIGWLNALWHARSEPEDTSSAS